MRASRLSLPVAVLLACSSQSLLAQTPIATGQSVDGLLESSDPQLSDGSHYDDHTITALAGDRLVITMRSSAFDTYLQWGEGHGDDFELEQTDDDGAGGTDSQLIITVPTAGRWTIRANSLAGDETGAYTLEVQGSTSAPAPVTAPGSVPSIALGQTAMARLESSDPLMEDDSHYDDYIYSGEPGDALVITLRTADFDAYLTWGTGVGSSFSAIISDDDSAGGTDSELRVSTGGGGPYVIRVNSLFADETGDYTLSVARGGDDEAAAASGDGGELEANQSVRGRLEGADPSLSDGSHFDSYIYRDEGGAEILITLTSEDFDAYLRGGRTGADGSFELIDSNDDGAGGTNSRLHARVPEDGIYVIQANSFSGGQTGDYTLAVQSAAGEMAASAETIRLGQVVSGQIAPSDPTLSDNSHYDLYEYQGEAGQQIIVTMRSDDFDAYLAGGRLVGDGLDVQMSNDDGGGGTDAQLTATVGSTGVFGIRANTLSAGKTGRYTLTVEAASGRDRSPSTPSAGNAVAIAIGETIRGSLGAGDPTLSDDSFFDQYVIQGPPGEQIQVSLTSSDFDSFLYWGRLAGADFIAQSNDDDSAGGSDAQMVVRIGSDGQYAIRANSFAPRATGDYSLAVATVAAPLADEPRTGSAGKWLFAYDAAPPALRPAAQRMKESQAFENLVVGLNDRFTLPRPLTIAGEKCGVENAYYSSSDEGIIFCYELYEMLGNIFVPDGQWTVEQREAVDGAVNFILMHEVGHAFVDLYDLPITGREEDAVDQLATMVLVDGGDKGAMAALNGVMALQPAENEFDQTDFADEHSLGPVRMFNVMCWIFGSNPDKYGGLVEGGMLPPDRAVGCPSEYEQLSKSWQQLLQGNANYLR